MVARVRTVRRLRTVALKAHHVGRLQQVRIVVGAVHVVAAVAAHAVRVHDALHEIIALHAILVRGAVGEMRERLFAEFVLFQLPEILQIHARPESRPANRNTFR